MAYIPGYKFDIFISYSHVDNQKAHGEEHGWIELFYTSLKELISQRIGRTNAVKIWWDRRKLDGSILFDKAIEAGIRQSAIIICLTSPGYLQSVYCKKELELFHSKGQKETKGLMIGNRTRIFNVLLNNIPCQNWPVELSGTTGFHFHDTTDEEDLGDPLDVKNALYAGEMKVLRNALVKLMEEFNKQVPESIAVEQEKKKEDQSVIFFGDVPDSLHSIRSRTFSELKKSGYTLLYDVPPPGESAQHEKAVMEKLAAADFSVHLLDQSPGKEIEDEEGMWYPLKQAGLGLQQVKPQLIWMPADTDLSKVDEGRYKTFLQEWEDGKHAAKNKEYIRGTKSTIAQQIIDFAEDLKKQRKQATAQKKVSVLLDTHLQDQEYAWELSFSLLKNNIQPFINPQEDDPLDNNIMLGDRISKVNKLVFFYGKIDWTWVQRRVYAALKLIINNDYGIDELLIFLAPPLKNIQDISFEKRFLKINVIDNSDTPQLKTDALQQVLKSLKPVV